MSKHKRLSSTRMSSTSAFSTHYNTSSVSFASTVNVPTRVVITPRTKNIFYSSYWTLRGSIIYRHCIIWSRGRCWERLSSRTVGRKSLISLSSSHKKTKPTHTPISTSYTQHLQSRFCNLLSRTNSIQKSQHWWARTLTLEAPYRSSPKYKMYIC